MWSVGHGTVCDNGHQMRLHGPPSAPALRHLKRGQWGPRMPNASTPDLPPRELRLRFSDRCVSVESLAHADAAEDSPWQSHSPLAEALRRCPCAKLVLTTRPSQQWYEPSLRWVLGRWVTGHRHYSAAFFSALGLRSDAVRRARPRAAGARVGGQGRGDHHTSGRNHPHLQRFATRLPASDCRCCLRLSPSIQSAFSACYLIPSTARHPGPKRRVEPRQT